MEDIMMLTNSFIQAIMWPDTAVQLDLHRFV